MRHRSMLPAEHIGAGLLVALHNEFDGLASGHFPAGSGTWPTKQTVKISVSKN
jgi:hypothetical protein